MQQRHPVRQSKGFLLVMGHIDGGNVARAQDAADLTQKALAQRPVESPQGFIEQQ